MALNDKQKRFVDEYLKDLNATQAAKRAGYSERTAHSTGPRLLEHAGVKELISQRKKARSRRTRITADRVLQEISHIAFADIGDVVEVEDQGVVRVLPLDTVPEEARRAISEITQTTTERYDPTDGATVEKTRTGVKHHSKLRALELLCKHLGICTDKVDVNVVVSELLAAARPKLGDDDYRRIVTALGEVTEEQAD